MKVLYLCGAGNSEGVRLALAVNERTSRWYRIVLLDDDAAKHGRSVLGVQVVGPIGMLQEAERHRAEVSNLVARTTAGRWAVRRKIEAYGLPFATMISPTVETRGVQFEPDITVYQNATLGPEASLGEGSVVFMGAVVGHESRVGRCCVMAANSVLNARVELGDFVYVGANATILPELRIGSGATIGAGSAVIQDVPPGATVMGVPAEVLIKPEEEINHQALYEFYMPLRRE